MKDHEGLAGTSDSSAYDTEVLLEQWKHAIESFRFGLSCMIQAGGFLIAADVLLAIWGLRERSGLLLLGASLMPLVLLIVISLTARATVPVVLTALATERALAPLPLPLISTFAGRINRSFVEQAEQAVTAGVHAAPKLTFRARRLKFLLVVTCLGQIAIGVKYLVG